MDRQRHDAAKFVEAVNRTPEVARGSKAERGGEGGGN